MFFSEGLPAAFLDADLFRLLETFDASVLWELDLNGLKQETEDCNV